MRWALLAGASVLLFTPVAGAQSTAPAAPSTTSTPAGVSAPPNRLAAYAPAVAVADAYVARELARPGRTMERRGVYGVPSGTVVRYAQRENGVVVRDGGAAVLVSPAGAVLAAHDFTAGALPAAPAHVIDAAQAAAIARATVGGDDPGDDAARTFLVWTREFGYPELVYECDFAPPAPTAPLAPRVLVRAQDGRVLRNANRVRDFRGRVFPANPASTPTMVDEELVGLPDGSTVLEGAEVHGFNCIDEGMTYNIQGTRAHMCSPEHTAHPDDTGLYAPDATQPQLADDPYGELSMYYHVSDFLRFMRTLGFTNFRTQPINAYANVRFPWDDNNFGGSGGGPLTGALIPWDNAAFIPGDPPNILGELYGGGHDVIMFGQGRAVDFSYDGDVVAHESGHSVVASTADFGWDFQDRWGTDDAPGSLNEGLADYFSAARSGDPDVGEYAGAIEGADSIRTLTCDNSYPGNLFGETHNDSQPTSCALWTIRSSVGADFDKAVLEALVMESPSPSHFSFATHVIEAAGRILGQSAADAATQEYTNRGILPEGPRVKRYRNGNNYMLLPGVDNSPLPYVPGYFQFKYTLPARSTSVRIEIPVYTNYPPIMHFAIRAGDAITYEYPSRGELTSTADAEQSVQDDGGGRPGATFELTPADHDQDLYVMIGMEDGFQSFAGPLSISSVQLSAPNDGGTDAAADAARDAHAGDAQTRDGHAGDGGDRVDVGGGCSAPPGRGAGGGRGVAWAAVFAAAAALVSRRRARTGSCVKKNATE